MAGLTENCEDLRNGAAQLESGVKLKNCEKYHNRCSRQRSITALALGSTNTEFNKRI